MSVLEEIRKQVLENPDLDIHEKMCLVALMCSPGSTDFESLAQYMGATRVTAANAFESLQRKGFFAEAHDDEDLRRLRRYLQKSPKPAPSQIIKASLASVDAQRAQQGDLSASEASIGSLDAADLNAGDPDLEVPAPKPAKKKTVKRSSDVEQDVDAVMSLIDENLTRSEASILLGFAGGDIKKIEGLYQRVRGTQVSDKIGALVNLLQTKDERIMNNQSKLLAYQKDTKPKK